jgi:hypothetical protein
MNIDHLELINEIAEYKDISEKIVSYIDLGYVEEIHRRRCQERDAIKRKRWKRSTNYYDSYKYCMLR